ncbi:unnamed protein product [Staurois parvus]|uniref:Uncharacterized protein n=1 Tax=Staurois parvus TaxID=386267 RepID=A0ABN9CRZ1_9NEOB|nr:unnamed protein product [Staurois parvus]
MEGIGTPESHDIEGIGTPESNDLEVGANTFDNIVYCCLGGILCIIHKGGI